MHPEISGHHAFLAMVVDAPNALCAKTRIVVNISIAY